VKAPTFLADDLAGVHAALATLACLRHRDRSGQGQHIDVSLLDSMLFQSTGYLTLGALGVDLPRLGNEFRIAAPARTFACRDGSVMAGVLLDSHWKRLARVLGRPELADHEDYATTAARIERRHEVNEMVSCWTRDRGVTDVVDAFARVGIPAAPVRTYAEAARDPHVRARDMLQDADGVPVTGPAAKLSRTPTRVRTAAAALGQHTAEILAEIDVDPTRLDALRAAGVV
jgi:formyl-CoA transferase